jgi:hypothetical protein
MDDASPAPAVAPAAGPAWRFLIRPRWLGWHLLMVVAFGGMLWLGDWQFHRALSGNGLSWAYTFEWPLFAAFAVYFWIKSLRDELNEHGGGGAKAQSAVAEFGAAASQASATSVPAAKVSGESKVEFWITTCGQSKDAMSSLRKGAAS